MGYRSRKLDMNHALSSYACLGHLNAAAVADDSLIAYLLVFAAMALPILAGTEDPFTEETVFFRL